MAILDDFIAQAFGPQGNMQPSGILNQPQEIPQEQPNIGFLQRVSQTPGMADAFLQAGAGLLSENKLGPGLAKGFAGFSRGGLEAGELLKPKVTPLAGGAFSQVSYADGTTKVVPNADVQKFLIEEATRKNTFAIDKIGANAAAQVGVAGAKADIKTGGEARPLLNDIQNLKSRWQDALGIVGSQGTGSQLQGALPGVAGFFGMDEAARNKILQGLSVDETLLNTARTKGAISNAEMDLFKSPIPSLTDDREKVWKPWIEKRIEVLTKLEGFYKDEVARGDNPGRSPSAPATGAPAPMTIPGLSPAASKYFQ